MAANTRRILTLLVVVFSLFGVAGCASTKESSAGTSSAVAAPLPDGGKYLVDYGIENGPPGFSVPEELFFVKLVDQNKTVAFSIDRTNPGSQEKAAEVTQYLHQNLDAMGFSITGESAEAIVFSSEKYDGAWTCGDEVCSLSLRLVK